MPYCEGCILTPNFNIKFSLKFKTYRMICLSTRWVTIAWTYNRHVRNKDNKDAKCLSKYHLARFSTPNSNFNYLDCFMAPSVSRSPSSAPSYLWLFIYLDCFTVHMVSKSQPSVCVVLCYPFLFTTYWFRQPRVFRRLASLLLLMALNCLCT